MSGYVDTGDIVDVSDSGQDYAKVYRKTFSAGGVVLGGNKASPASGAGSNYFVFILPYCD